MSTVSVAAGAAALHGDHVVAVVLALAGVVLARTVFVDRENKKLGRRQSLRETLPLTLVAMLIAGVIVYDRGFGYSEAAFTGLGVGWAAITALDAIGRRIVDPAAGVEPEPHKTRPRKRGERLRDPIDAHDPVMLDHLDKLDRIDKFKDAGT